MVKKRCTSRDAAVVGASGHVPSEPVVSADDTDCNNLAILRCQKNHSRFYTSDRTRRSEALESWLCTFCDSLAGFVRRK